ncbi:hypothetical protein AB0O39_39195 [Streptomyces anulatus]|uniref:hypothetical protein n=1 Tax=Streptomyces anulatus TaxID=1892 RepID=UPI0034460602
MTRVGTALTTVIAALGALALAPAPAHAQAGDLACLPPTSSTVTFTPALTTLPQDVTVHSTNLFGPCTSATVPGITSGTFSGTFAVPGRSCLTLAGSGTSRSTITWNTGQTSTLTLNYTTQIVGAVYTSVLTGVVSGGLFQGDSVVSNQTGPATDILTCTLGLGTVSGISTVGALTFL